MDLVVFLCVWGRMQVSCMAGGQVNILSLNHLFYPSGWVLIRLLEFFIIGVKVSRNKMLEGPAMKFNGNLEKKREARKATMHIAWCHVTKISTINDCSQSTPEHQSLLGENIRTFLWKAVPS